jgi:hypothetical protein
MEIISLLEVARWLLWSIFIVAPLLVAASAGRETNSVAKDWYAILAFALQLFVALALYNS